MPLDKNWTPTTAQKPQQQEKRICVVFWTSASVFSSLGLVGERLAAEKRTLLWGSMVARRFGAIGVGHIVLGLHNPKLGTI